MSNPDDNPDVVLAIEYGRRGCKHERVGPMTRVVSSGGGRIGAWMSTYTGCLDCGKDLSVKLMLEAILVGPADPDKVP